MSKRRGQRQALQKLCCLAKDQLLQKLPPEGIRGFCGSVWRWRQTTHNL
eukprot:CAMPEP_0177536060 /NCGR_PEP_ID=MMETSP0369-20130122/56940_1 /TAXON_ID=447022 ORGANISM="Scrippsiella hangoei-like, Strain SHHI-4" /NCGR_SAMPLE_ID=MMETSP0369 /ASSEMBLY_ACC=CAM_ASM_000364 /LENGTH=48 /DNA_ID= /DNA_START= /DNA_END= /DNA_ORIENTATION=